MRLLIQRVSAASVRVEGQLAGAIGKGLCVFVCAMEGDTQSDLEFAVRKLSTLRIFPDADGKMNLDLRQAGGALLLVSQFTLSADTTSGTRPSFSGALEPQAAEQLLGQLKLGLEALGLAVEQGRFGAKMEVEIHNDGPVTIYLDSRNKK